MHRLLPLLMATGALALAGCNRHDETSPKPIASATTDTTPAAGVAATPGTNGQVVAANTAGTSGAPSATTSGADTSATATTSGPATGTTMASAGPDTANATATSGTSSGGADTGKTVYNQTCVACHGAGVAGAPKFGDKAAWAPRIAKGKAMLYDHAIHGFQGTSGAMPARGGSTASDADVKAAVDYMVSQAK